MSHAKWATKILLRCKFILVLSVFVNFSCKPNSGSLPTTLKAQRASSDDSSVVTTKYLYYRESYRKVQNELVSKKCWYYREIGPQDWTEKGFSRQFIFESQGLTPKGPIADFRVAQGLARRIAESTSAGGQQLGLCMMSAAGLMVSLTGIVGTGGFAAAAMVGLGTASVGAGLNCLTKVDNITRDFQKATEANSGRNRLTTSSASGDHHEVPISNYEIEAFVTSIKEAAIFHQDNSTVAGIKGCPPANKFANQDFKKRFLNKTEKSLEDEKYVVVSGRAVSTLVHRINNGNCQINRNSTIGFKAIKYQTIKNKEGQNITYADLVVTAPPKDCSSLPERIRIPTSAYMINIE